MYGRHRVPMTRLLATEATLQTVREPMEATHSTAWGEMAISRRLRALAAVEFWPKAEWVASRTGQEAFFTVGITQRMAMESSPIRVAPIVGPASSRGTSASQVSPPA